MRGARPQGVGGANARPREGTWARVGHLLQGAPAILGNPGADPPSASPEAERTPHSAKAATSSQGPPPAPWKPRSPGSCPFTHLDTGEAPAAQEEARRGEDSPRAGPRGAKLPHPQQSQLPGRDVGIWSVRNVTDPLGAGRGPQAVYSWELPPRAGAVGWAASPGRLLLQPGPGSEPPPGPAPWAGAGPRCPDPRRERRQGSARWPRTVCGDRGQGLAPSSP